MTPREFCEFLATCTASGTIEFNDSLSLKIGTQDAKAGEVLLWLLDTMPDDTTIGQLDDTLDAAKWWLTFWAAMPKEDGEP